MVLSLIALPSTDHALTSCRLRNSTYKGVFPGQISLIFDKHPISSRVRAMGQSSTIAASQPGALASTDSKIVIIGGGGTMGSSTALHLSRRGFTDIRIMDVYPIPSNNSAGNDLNKVSTKVTLQYMELV